MGVTDMAITSYDPWKAFQRRRLIGTVIVLVLVGGVFFAWGLAAPEEHVVEIELNGIACGSHLGVNPPYLEVEKGSWIRVVNTSPWAHSVQLSREDSPFAPAQAKSPRIEPGESWRFRAGQSGVYYIVSDNQWHHLSGLRGQLLVQR